MMFKGRLWIAADHVNRLISQGSEFLEQRPEGKVQQRGSRRRKKSASSPLTAWQPAVEGEWSSVVAEPSLDLDVPAGAARACPAAVPGDAIVRARAKVQARRGERSNPSERIRALHRN